MVAPYMETNNKEKEMDYTKALEFLKESLEKEKQLTKQLEAKGYTQTIVIVGGKSYFAYVNKDPINVDEFQ